MPKRKRSWLTFRPETFRGLVHFLNHPATDADSWRRFFWPDRVLRQRHRLPLPRAPLPPSLTTLSELQSCLRIVVSAYGRECPIPPWALAFLAERKSRVQERLVGVPPFEFDLETKAVKELTTRWIRDEVVPKLSDGERVFLAPLRSLRVPMILKGPKVRRGEPEVIAPDYPSLLSYETDLLLRHVEPERLKQCGECGGLLLDLHKGRRQRYHKEPFPWQSVSCARRVMNRR